MNTRKTIHLIIYAAGLILLTGACSLSALRSQANQTPNAIQGPTQTPYVLASDTPVPAAPTAVELTDTPYPTVEPGTTPTYAPVPADGNNYSYQGVQFSLDPAVASSVSGRVIPENPGSADGPYWAVNPQYVDIALGGYPLTQTAFSPVISVYPVEDYRRLSSMAAAVLDDLSSLLAQKPAAVDKMPFLPVMNAGQVFHADVQYLDFQNGSGVRYLTLYAQYAAPINNQDLFYTFQGLTSDGRYFVSIILPVNHPSLPASMNDLSASELEAIIQDPSYYGRMAKTLEPLASDTFTPDLGKLDALVTSLAIND